MRTRVLMVRYSYNPEASASTVGRSPEAVVALISPCTFEPVRIGVRRTKFGEPLVLLGFRRYPRQGSNLQHFAKKQQAGQTAILGG